MFAPLTTERLVLRPARASDADALYQRRADPAVSDWQDWPMPYSRERAEAAVSRSMQNEDPPDDGGFMLTITDRDDSVIYGDLSMFLKDDGRTAAVGYSVTPAHWGNGYASEALTAVLDWLFDVKGISRAYAELDPDNHRSARVLETCGFVYEGRLHNSCWIEDDVSDDAIYGLTPALRSQWNSRPTAAPATVELVEPYPVGLRTVLELAPHHSQQRFVAPIESSLSQVAVPPYEEGFDEKPGDPRVIPWPRIVHADGAPVGFVMLQEPTETKPEPYLWRLVIDRMHQRRGIGKRVVQAVVDQAQQWGATSMAVSWVPGVGSPEPLYMAMGFEPTGEVHDGEIEGRLVFS